MVVMKMFPRFSASKVLASAALMLFAFTGAFAQGKVFNKYRRHLRNAASWFYDPRGLRQRDVYPYHLP